MSGMKNRGDVVKPDGYPTKERRRLDLIERLRKATGPDRQLDRLIEETLPGVLPHPDRGEPNKICAGYIAALLAPFSEVKEILAGFRTEIDELDDGGPDPNAAP